MPIPSTDYDATIVASNPMAFYDLQQQSGNALDLSAHGRHATVGSAVDRAAPGVFTGETSYYFDGADSWPDAWVLLPAAARPANQVPMSVEVICKRALAWDFLIYMATASYRLYTQWNGVGLSHHRDVAFGSQGSSAGDTWWDEWAHVVWTNDGGATPIQNVWINGEYLGGTSGNAFSPVQYLGHRPDDDRYTWHGWIARCAIYARALTSGEVASHFAFTGLPHARAGWQIGQISLGTGRGDPTVVVG